MPKWVLIHRALVPPVVVRLYYFYQHRALVSGWAEVDLSSQTRWGRGYVISSFVKFKIVGLVWVLLIRGRVADMAHHTHSVAVYQPLHAFGTRRVQAVSG
jgi:hypothetical protein